MPLFVYSDNARSTLGSAIGPGTTTITLAPGGGATFPNPTGGRVFALTLNDLATHQLFEVCYCSARNADVLTVQRGQEGTTARSWGVGDFAWNGPTSGQAANWVQSPNMLDGSISPTFGPTHVNGLLAVTGNASAKSVDSTDYIRSAVGTGFSHVQVFGAPGTFNFTVPANVNLVHVECYGAGGGGGACNVTGGAASGGGSGAIAYGLVTVTPAQIIPVVVGARGTSSTDFANGGNGGTSSFGSAITCTGGAGGAGSGGGPQTAVGAGGQAFGGYFALPGNPGSAGMQVAGVGLGGNGGGGYYFPMIPGTTGNSGGTTVNVGASGGANGIPGSGAAGGQGLVIVRW